MFVDLHRGYICIDCDTIFDPSDYRGASKEIQCPRCASRVAIPLARWLRALDMPTLEAYIREEACRVTSVELSGN